MMSTLSRTCLNLNQDHLVLVHPLPDFNLSSATVFTMMALTLPSNTDLKSNQLLISAHLFQHHFGIKFSLDKEQYVGPISPFEFMRCFNMQDDLTYRLSHQSNQFSLDGAVPAFTSSYIFQHVHERLQQILTSNLQIFVPHLIHAPAALSNNFVCKCTIGAKLPDADTWVCAFDADESTHHIMRLIRNPGLISAKTLLLNIASTLTSLINTRFNMS
jgi:hypothetical protein